MAKIKKFTTAKENDPIYQEGWSVTTLNYRYLQNKTAREQTSNSLDKETANVKKRWEEI